MSTSVYTKIFVVYLALIIVILSSLKWRTGTDWPAYVDVYQSINAISVINDHFEPLYVFLVKGMRAVSDSFSFYIILMSILTIGIKFYAISKLRYPLTGILLFAVSFQFNIFFVRYDLALSIVLLLLVINRPDKPIQVARFLVPIGFHKIAIVAMLFDLLRVNRKTKIDKVVYAAGAVTLLVAVFYFVTQASFIYKTANNIYSFEVSDEISIKIIHRVWYLILISYLMFSSFPSENDRPILKLLVLGAVFYLAIGIFSFGSIERVFGLFLIYEIYYLSKVKIRHRHFYLAVFFSTIGFVRVFQFLSSDYSDLYFPYETILEIQFKDVY